MLDVNRVLELSASVLHVVGGLSASVAHLVGGDAVGAINTALIVAACILFIAGAMAVAEIGRLVVRLFVHWCEQRYLYAPRNKEGRDA